MNELYKPEFFRINIPADQEAFDQLLAANPFICLFDEMDGQLRELIKSLHPAVKLKADQYPELIRQHLQGADMRRYGVWVYYPWCSKMVHLLDEAEFVEVRTNRNRYKITPAEQQLLSRKKIGIVGLSVGQSIALTLAMERSCGELRLADFDTAELSNLNRIRTGVFNLGLRKTVIAAREISEIDPFLQVTIYNDGLTRQNIDVFFNAGGRLDLLVEVCDGLDVKILSRFKARELHVPVVMDTNDRGMLDVERFDLEPERPILHGLAGDLDPDNIGDLTNEEKIPYILKMIGAESISTRLKASMLEVEQSINTWPQLASSVTLGGAITTDVCRNIFLDRFHDSGRYYIDLDELIKDKTPAVAISQTSLYDGPPELSIQVMEMIAEKYVPLAASDGLPPAALQQIAEAASLAPSGGNSQPWRFLYKNDRFYIYHDAFHSYSLLDYNNLGSCIAFGAMLENIRLRSATLGLAVREDVFPLNQEDRLVAVLSFKNEPVHNTLLHLAPVIGTRLTNRSVTERKSVAPADVEARMAMAETIDGASLKIFDTEDALQQFAELLTNTERLRFLHPQGHYDTFVKELRFGPEEVETTADGLDVATLNMKESDIAALSIARDPSAISFLHGLHKGSGFKKISRQNVLTASAIGVIVMNGHDQAHFLDGGRALERVWLEANYRNISFQPVAQVIFMTELLMANRGTDFNAYEHHQLQEIHDSFLQLISLEPGRFPVFVFRLYHHAGQPAIRSLRRPINEVLHISRPVTVHTQGAV